MNDGGAAKDDPETDDDRRDDGRRRVEVEERVQHDPWKENGGNGKPGAIWTLCPMPGGNGVMDSAPTCCAGGPGSIPAVAIVGLSCNIQMIV